MENKQEIEMEKGEWSLTAWFFWFRENVLQSLNKKWEVLLPPNRGVAVFRDSQNRVTLDLTKTTFGDVGGGFPTTDGTYVYVVTAGVGSWELVGTETLDVCGGTVDVLTPPA